MRTFLILKYSGFLANEATESWSFPFQKRPEPWVTAVQVISALLLGTQDRSGTKWQTSHFKGLTLVTGCAIVFSFN